MISFKVDVQGQEGGRISDVAGQGGWESLKLKHFHGRHIYIVPYAKNKAPPINISSLNFNVHFYLPKNRDIIQRNEKAICDLYLLVYVM